MGKEIAKKKTIENRVKFLIALMVCMYAVLLSRIGYLQLYGAEKFKLEAEQNRTQLAPVAAARGEIKDRNGLVLAKSKQGYTVSISLVDLKKEDQEAVFSRLAEIIKLPVEEIRNAVKNQQRKYEPVEIMVDVPLDTVTKIEEKRVELPGVIIEVKPLRYYPYSDFASHVIGYTRQVDGPTYQKFKEKYPEENYQPSDRFGRAGLEQWFEAELHGLDGDIQIEVDHLGRPVKKLGIRDPIPGNDLILTLDHKVQKAAEESLVRTMAAVQGEFKDARAGAAVLIDVRTGAIIAMASKPSFDPNRFNKPIPISEWNAYFSDKLPFPPLVNRAIRPYAPGSTFKMVTASAALETKKFTAKTVVFDPGYYRLGNRPFKCWQTSGHGRVDLKRSLQVSCNTYYYTAGRATGNEAIAKYAKLFGLGETSGITLPGEAAGTVPSATWKKETNESILNRRYQRSFDKIKAEYTQKINQAATEQEREKLRKKMDRALKDKEAQYKYELNWETTWHDFDTLNMSIGQGANYYTPLQLANYVAAIANGGTLNQPYLVQEIRSGKGTVIQRHEPEIIRKVPVSAKNLELIREGMRAVAQPGGTAYGRFSTFPVPVAAKTGTAQVFGKDNHGLFVGFAPYDKPEVAVAAIVEYGGHGGSSAGVVGKDILAAYFNINPEIARQGAASNEE